MTYNYGKIVLISQGIIKNINTQHIKGKNCTNNVAFFIFLSKSLLALSLFLLS